jgi:hypothetical protein
VRKAESGKYGHNKIKQRDASYIVVQNEKQSNEVE